MEAIALLSLTLCRFRPALYRVNHLLHRLALGRIHRLLQSELAAWEFAGGYRADRASWLLDQRGVGQFGEFWGR